jgi:hypothetical protein
MMLALESGAALVLFVFVLGGICVFFAIYVVGDDE